MNYDHQLESLVDYFKSGETDPDNLQLGTEIEHFIVQQKDLTAVSYYEKNGIEDLLHSLSKQGWKPEFEGKHLLELYKCNNKISLEPGGQLELSIGPSKCLASIEKEYLKFLDEVIPLLNVRDQYLITTGYQPVSSIEDIPLLPKERYKYMYDYVKTRGKYAHNMMKGTASLQLSVDYINEKDYIMKYKVANFLSPIIYTVFDNAPFFEGKTCKTSSIRSHIWSNCDNMRCGIIDKIFDDDYGYESYADYILNTPSIIVNEGGKLLYTKNRPFKEFYDPDKFSRKELEYILTMVFPDVRTKHFIEIRMGDVLPYPLNLSYLAFWKGIIYNRENLNDLFHTTRKYNKINMKNLKQSIRKKGLDAEIENTTVISYFKKLLEMAEQGLSAAEGKYLVPLHEMIARNKIPKQITLNNLDNGLKEALNWCVLNNIMRCNDNACRCIF